MKILWKFNKEHLFPQRSTVFFFSLQQRRGVDSKQTKVLPIIQVTAPPSSFHMSFVVLFLHQESQSRHVNMKFYCTFMSVVWYYNNEKWKAESSVSWSVLRPCQCQTKLIFINLTCVMTPCLINHFPASCIILCFQTYHCMAANTHSPSPSKSPWCWGRLSQKFGSTTHQFYSTTAWGDTEGSCHMSCLYMNHPPKSLCAVNPSKLCYTPSYHRKAFYREGNQTVAYISSIWRHI